MDWAKTIAKRYKKHLKIGFGVTYTRCFTVHIFVIKVIHNTYGMLDGMASKVTIKIDV